jgi:hypothetical protein
MEEAAQMNEEEEFEFRARMEQEAAASTGQVAVTEPSMGSVALNAAAKGVAGFGDMFLNAPVNAYNVAKAGATLAGVEGMEITPQPNVIEKGMRAIGAISEEREPQTAGQRILDLAVQTGVGMAASPAGGITSAARNIGLGLATGAAAGVTKEATGSDLAATAVGLATPLATRGAVSSRANAPVLKNPVKLQTAQEGMAAGYVVPPSYLKPSFTTNRLEGAGGKAAIKQEAQALNVDVTDNLARKAIGMPEGTPLTKESLAEVHERANGPYRDVEALRATTTMPWFPRYHSTSLLEDLKAARSSATRTFQEYNRSLNTETLAKAKAFSAEAESIERDIEKVAKAAGRPELVQQLKDARTLHAKVYDVERAMNYADGHVSATVLGRMYAKGKPLSEELKVIGKFAKAFPDAIRDSSRIQSAGVSGTEAAASAGLGMLGFGTGGAPAALIAGGLPLLRSPARSALLSGMYQRRLLAEPPALNQAMLKSVLAGRSIAESP